MPGAPALATAAHHRGNFQPLLFIALVDQSWERVRRKLFAECREKFARQSWRPSVHERRRGCPRCFAEWSV